MVLTIELWLILNSVYIVITSNTCTISYTDLGSNFYTNVSNGTEHDLNLANDTVEFLLTVLLRP